jgi:hypothetical protein
MNKNVVLSLAAVLTLAAAAAPASAGSVTGYVCNFALQPAPMSQFNGIGNEGDIQLILNSQPDCGGTQVAYVYLFSVGATYPGANTMYLYTAAELQTIYQALVTSRNKATQRSISLGTNSIQGLQINFQ